MAAYSPVEIKQENIQSKLQPPSHRPTTFFPLPGIVVDFRNPECPIYQNTSPAIKLHNLFGLEKQGVFDDIKAGKEIDDIQSLINDIPRQIGVSGCFTIQLKNKSVLRHTNANPLTKDDQQTIKDNLLSADFTGYVQGIASLFSRNMSPTIISYLQPFLFLEKTLGVDVSTSIINVTIDLINEPTLLQTANNHYLYSDTATIPNFSIGELPLFSDTRIIEMIECWAEGAVSHQRTCIFSSNNNNLFELICAIIPSNVFLLQNFTVIFYAYISEVLHRTDDDKERQIIIKNFCYLFDKTQSQLTIAYNFTDLQTSMLSIGMSLKNQVDLGIIQTNYAIHKQTFLYENTLKLRTKLNTDFFAYKNNTEIQQLILDKLKVLNYYLPKIINLMQPEQQQFFDSILTKYEVEKTQIITQQTKNQIQDKIAEIKKRITNLEIWTETEKVQKPYKNLLTSMTKIFHIIEHTLCDLQKLDIDQLLQPMREAIREFQPITIISWSIFQSHEQLLYFQLQNLHEELYLKIIETIKNINRQFISEEEPSTPAPQQAMITNNDVDQSKISKTLLFLPR